MYYYLLYIIKFITLKICRIIMKFSLKIFVAILDICKMLNKIFVDQGFICN